MSDEFDLRTLGAIVRDRRDNPIDGSYTCELFRTGQHGIAAKVREETDELIDAVAGEGEERTVEEAADLLYHVLVLLASAGVGLDRVINELAARHHGSDPRD